MARKRKSPLPFDDLSITPAQWLKTRVAKTTIQAAKQAAWREAARYEEGGIFPYINVLGLLRAEAASTREAVAHSKKLSQGRPRNEVMRRKLRDLLREKPHATNHEVWRLLHRLQDGDDDIISQVLARRVLAERWSDCKGLPCAPRAQPPRPSVSTVGKGGDRGSG
jgi:hypothetical protein